MPAGPGLLERGGAELGPHRVPEVLHVDAVGPCYEVSPAGVGFLFPATVTFELDAGEMHDGVPVGDLALIVARGPEWTVLADRVIDLEDGTISASAVYLSSFAVAQMK